MPTNAYAASRYSRVAILLHWAIALLILFNLTTGFFHHAVPKGIWAFHVSSGITILALTLVRIVWRVTHKPPPFLPMQPWERVAAHVVHFALYFVMLAAPLTGWAMVSTHVDKPAPAAAAPGAPPPAAHRMMVWGLFELPKLAPIVKIGEQPDGSAKLKAAHETFEGRHLALGWIMLGLLVLHLGGALKHQLVDKQRELARMGLGTPRAVY